MHPKVMTAFYECGIATKVYGQSSLSKDGESPLQQIARSGPCNRCAAALDELTEAMLDERSLSDIKKLREHCKEKGLCSDPCYDVLAYLRSVIQIDKIREHL